MAKGNEILLKLKADNKELSAKLKQSEKKLNSFEKKVKRAGNKVKASTSKMAGLFGLIGGAAVIAGFKKVISITNKQIKVETQLNAVLKSTQHAAGLTAEEVKKMAAELQKVTTFGDETILVAQNMLLTFKEIGKEVFPEATEAVLDMATAMDVDLKSASIMIGKVLNDPIANLSALARNGIQFTEVQKDMIKQLIATGQKMEAQKIILKELASEFGGSARAQAKTFAGIMKRISNRIGDMVEKVGNKLIPDLKKMGNVMVAVSGQGGALFKMLEGLLVGVATVAKWVTSLVGLLNQITLKAKIFGAELANKSKIKELKETRKEVEKLNEAFKKSATRPLGSIKKYIKLKEKEKLLVESISGTGEKIAGWSMDNVNNAVALNELYKKNKKELDDVGNKLKNLKPPPGPRDDGKGKKGPKLKPVEDTEYFGYLNDRLNAELAAEKEKYEKLKAMLIAHKKDTAEIESAHDRKSMAIKTAYYVSGVQGMMNQVVAVIQQAQQNEMMGLQFAQESKLRQFDEETEAKRAQIEASIEDETARDEALKKFEEGRAKEKQKLEAEFEYRRAKLAYEQAKVTKKINIVQAIMNTAIAATKALAQGGFFGGPPMAA